MQQGTDCCGQTPYDVALLHHHPDTAAALQKLGRLVQSTATVTLSGNTTQTSLAADGQTAYSRARSKQPQQKLQQLRAQTHAQAAERANALRRREGLPVSPQQTLSWNGVSENTRRKAQAAEALLRRGPRTVDEEAQHGPYCNMIEVDGMPNITAMAALLVQQRPVMFRRAAKYFMRNTTAENADKGASASFGWTFASLYERFGHVEVVTQTTDSKGIQALETKSLSDFLTTVMDPAVSQNCCFEAQHTNRLASVGLQTICSVVVSCRMSPSACRHQTCTSRTQNCCMERK